MAARVCFCFGHCIRLGSWPFSRLAIWSPCQRQSRRRAIFADLLIWMNGKSPSGRGSAPPPLFFSFFHDLSSLLSPSSSSSDSQLLLLVLTLARVPAQVCWARDATAASTRHVVVMPKSPDESCQGPFTLAIKRQRPESSSHGEHMCK